MKKIVVSSFLLLGALFLSGCGQQQVYKNKEKGFSLNYSSDWKTFENPIFGNGTIFMPNTYDENKILKGTYDKQNDCLLGVGIISSAVKLSSFCKNNNGDVLLGKNDFKVCAFSDIDSSELKNSYVIVEPNSSYTLKFDFNDKNVSCKKKCEDILATLAF